MKPPYGKDAHKGRPAAADHSDDDVWQHTAATIEPLKRGKPRIHTASEAAKGATRANPLEMSEAEPAHKVRPPKLHSRALPHEPSPKPPAKTVPELALFDRNSMRKIRSGRTEIEARVDLHGMRQDEAHAALRKFLLRSQNRGLRFVLVITGKGKASAADSTFANHEGERGILKRNVPRWLEEADLRRIVVSYSNAAIQHGGEGAIYVHLRAKDRA